MVRSQDCAPVVSHKRGRKDARGFTCIDALRDWRSSVLNALDFAETRSQEDAKLLGTARNKKKGDRLTEDEALSPGSSARSMACAEQIGWVAPQCGRHDGKL